MTDRNANKIGYKKTKLGWIPEEWEVTQLSSVCQEIIGGGTPTTQSKNFWNGNIPWISSFDIKKNGKIYVRKFITQEAVIKSATNIIPLGSVIVVTRIGLGKVALADFDLCTSQDFQSIIVNNAFINNRYLKYFISNQIDKILKKCQGSTIKGITKDQIYNMLVIRPKLKEQEKIAEVLSCWDEGIEVLEKLLEKKQLHKKALMQRLLSRKLILCCSEKWKHAKFNSLFERIVRKNKELNKNILTISAQQGLISQKNFYNKRIASIDTSKYILLEFGEFAYNKSFSNGYPLGAIKRLELYQKGVVSSLYICFKLKDKNGCSDYWKYYFEAGMLNKEIKMIAQEGARNHGLLNMTTEDFFNILLYYPEDKNEQQKIAEILNNCDEEIRLLDKKLEILKQQKKGLMQKLLTGEIRVKV